MENEKPLSYIERCEDCGVGYFIFLRDGRVSKELFSREEGLELLDKEAEQKFISLEEKEELMIQIALDDDLMDTREEAELWLKATEPLGPEHDLFDWLQSIEQVYVKQGEFNMSLSIN